MLGLSSDLAGVATTPPSSIVLVDKTRTSAIVTVVKTKTRDEEAPVDYEPSRFPPFVDHAQPQPYELRTAQD